MVKGKRNARIAGPGWAPARHAVWSQRFEAVDEDSSTTVLLQHPVDPYIVAHVDATEETLRRVAFNYLSAATALGTITPPLRLPATWLKALAPGAISDEFGWMTIDWPLADGATEVNAPFGSFRSGPADGDHLVALFAAQRAGQTFFLGSGYGLRVVLRLRVLEDRTFEASIIGMAACLPPETSRLPREFWKKQRIDPSDFRRFVLSAALKTRIASATSLRDISIRGVRVMTPEKGVPALELRGTGHLDSPLPQGRGTPFAFVLRSGPDGGLDVVHQSPLVADAQQGDGFVFIRDPASQGSAKDRRERSTMVDAKVLESFRTEQTITGVLDGPLDDGTSAFEVLDCHRFVATDPPDAVPPPHRRVRLPATAPTIRNSPPVRSDDASAVQGFWHVRDLFERMEAYGLPPATYFRIAKEEVDVFYRSGVSPGPGKDGRDINARVLPTGWLADAVGPVKIGDRPALELHLSIANRTKRHRSKRTTTAPSPAIPLGIGADPRWMWHEFGHVLLMASIGELELRWAHSPGDALSAIVADPESSLAVDPLWRYATFPWVFLPRRHDRCTLDGWSWSGAMHAALARVPDADQPRRKGYASEQILSSSLFRLYRCLGGDTLIETGGAANIFERQRASHYTLFLVMQGLKLLGDSAAKFANHPDELVQSIIDADRTTGVWNATYPKGSATSFPRVGGCAIKAIHWAFEAQGLYAAPGTNNNAPGSAPPVDLYIASRRASIDVTPYGAIDYGPGNYMPVSLHWQTPNDPATPDWQADATAVIVVAGGDIEVTVGNRGQNTATQAGVAVWWTAWSPNDAAPLWPDPRWSPAVGTIAASDIAAGATQRFGPFYLGKPTGPHLVLAVAHCHADRPIIDPGSILTCSTVPTPVIDIVANDNNLALLFVP